MACHQKNLKLWQKKLGHFFQDWGSRIFLVFLAVFWLGLVAATWSNAAEVPQNDDEYSFNWLDPDKKIYVLQNRKYLKASHALISLLTGVGFSNPYCNAYNLEG